MRLSTCCKSNHCYARKNKVIVIAPLNAACHHTLHTYINQNSFRYSLCLSNFIYQYHVAVGSCPNLCHSIQLLASSNILTWFQLDERNRKYQNLHKRKVHKRKCHLKLTTHRSLTNLRRFSNLTESWTKFPVWMFVIRIFRAKE